MNRKISKGMIVKIHPRICNKRIPKILSDQLNYTFINHVKNFSLKVTDLFYKRVCDSSFYEFVVNSDNQEMVRFRAKFNIDSILADRNGYQCILMARIEPKEGSRFQIPVCFLIESFDVPLSIY
jgi:hypothetical protein